MRRHKKCLQCGKTKQLHAFALNGGNSRDGRHPRCKECTAARARADRAARTADEIAYDKILGNAAYRKQRDKDIDRHRRLGRERMRRWRAIPKNRRAEILRKRAARAVIIQAAKKIPDER